MSCVGKSWLVVVGIILVATSGCGNGGTDACAGITCSGHGTCVVNGGVAECQCNQGYYPEGLECVDPCAGVTCSGHGTCVDNNGNPQCQCDQGYYPEGLECVDPCAGVTCSGHGTCVDNNGDPQCQCDSGYNPDGLNCISVCEGVLCSGHGTCQIVGGNPECQCDSDYVAEGLSCVHILCSGVTCFGHGSCQMVGGVPECQCDAGYHPEGLYCFADADPCTGVDCCLHGTCNVAGGSPRCQCDNGYHAEDIKCARDYPAQWPPTLAELYLVGTGCVIPECDECGSAGFDPRGIWVATLTTTSSNCSATVQQLLALARVGNIDVGDPEPLPQIVGSCMYDQNQEQIGTAINGSTAVCMSEVDPQYNVVAFQTMVVAFAGQAGAGTSHVYLTNVPPLVGGDCDFELSVDYQRQ